MGKLAFWFIVIVGGLIVARLLARQAGKENQPRPVRQAAPRSGRGSPETMVRCAHCGIHLPRSEALLVGGKTWCSKEHAKLGAPK